jgi:putative ABC transport system ATP-binding protein
MSTYSIQLEGLRKTYGQGDAAVDALKNVNMQIAPGEVVGLIGPSGSGKSTLLKCLGAVIEPTAGRMTLGGEVIYENGWKIKDLRALRRDKIGFIFQAPYLIPFLNVTDNVALLPMLAGVKNSIARARAKELLEALGVAHRANANPSELSGGEQQRIALARALAPQPPVVLLDEPYGALDEVLREELGWEVKEILSRRHTAAILVTHDRHEAITLGDRVAVMDSGQILQCDAPRTVYDKPATRFVADFLAVSSYLSTSLGEETLVRPHQLRVSAGGPHTVLRVEFLGATSRYTIRTASGAIVVADVEPSTALNVDDSCDVHIRERHGE